MGQSSRLFFNSTDLQLVNSNSHNSHIATEFVIDKPSFQKFKSARD